MFFRKKKSQSCQENPWQLYSESQARIWDLEEENYKLRRYVPIALESLLISYCRVYGKRIHIQGCEPDYPEYFENAIIFDQPFIRENGKKLIGICYHPEFDDSNVFDKQTLLTGKHLGLEGIRSLTSLGGDEAEYLEWEEIGQGVLDVLENQFRDRLNAFL